MYPYSPLRITTLLALISGMMISLLSCQKPIEKTTIQLLGQEWGLVLYSSPLGLISPPLDYPITAKFDQNRLLITAGCMAYTFPFEQVESQLTIAVPELSPYSNCPGSQQEEAHYVSLLAGSHHFTLKHDQLHLQAEQGELIFLPKTGSMPLEWVQRLQGSLVLGNEVSVFRACQDPTLSYWVQDESQQLDSLYQRVASREYEPVFVEVKAIKHPRLELGYAEEHDGFMRIIQIIEINPYQTQNCQPKS